MDAAAERVRPGRLSRAHESRQTVFDRNVNKGTKGEQMENIIMAVLSVIIVAVMFSDAESHDP